MAKLSALIPKYRERLTTVAQNSFVEVAARTIDRTPVDTGLLEDSWTPDINKFNYSNEGGSIPAVAAQMKIGDRLTLSNAQPYVRIIEYTGHSAKAPNGMMRISVAEWQSIVRTEASALAR